MPLIRGLLEEIEMTKQYISCAETAKLVRAALKESFPGVKFSVRSSVYAGGASITVKYVDGPAYESVKNVVGCFEGAYFDGMTDYQGTKYNSLDGQEVYFGANFIFVERKFSVGLLTQLVAEAAAYYGVAIPKIRDTSWGAVIESCDYNDERLIMGRVGQYSADDAAESATLNRVRFLGDDGYGYGSVGRLAA